MGQKISSYIVEIIIGIVIFVGILFLLPKNRVEIPDLSSLQVPESDVNFVFSVNTGQDTGSQALIDTGDVQQNTGTIVTTGDINSGSIDEPLMETGIVATKPGIVETGIQTIPNEPISYETCQTPWGDSLLHGQSIFAYSQRMDEPDMCNIQRRTCNDGVLDGSYTQQSCLTYASSSIEYEAVVSYNNPYSDPYIQPDRNGQSVDGKFDTQGQLSDNRYGEPTSYRDASAGAIPYQDAPVSQTQTNYGACMTPWGQTIKHGQFVKAYQLDKGFTNLACEVQLRTCIDGDLEGTFTFDSCNYYNIAVEDFLNDYYDPIQPSLVQLIEVLQSMMRQDGFKASYPNIPYNNLNRFINNLQ